MSEKIPERGPMQRPDSVEEGAKMLKEHRFEAPDECDEVVFTTEEFTSVCPATGQPDFSTLEIRYVPDEFCIESKSLKYYLWAFRDYGGYCETLTQEIAEHIMKNIEPDFVQVNIEQNVRGGIALDASTALNKFNANV